MKLLVYEVKKILNVKLLIVLCLFTMLFYNMFIQMWIHPQDSADCRAQNDFATALREEYGYDTHLPYEDYAVLEELRQEQIRKLDKMVQKSSILQDAGITSYQQLRATEYETMSDAVEEELNRIVFDEGIREVFLKQQIDGLYEDMKICPVFGVEAGKELEAADKLLLYGSMYDDYTKEAIERVASVIKENRLSLMPNSILHHLLFDFPRFGILLVISCLLLILPYQIRERLAGVNPLMATTHIGRSLWKWRYDSAVIACVLVCAVQSIVFCMVLNRADALQYWNYAISGNDRDMFWFDLNFGIYLMVNFVLYTIVTISTMTVFYLISRLSANYIVGVAIGIPVTVVVGVLLTLFTKSFLDVQRSMLYDVFRPICFVLILFVIAMSIVFALQKWDKRRDVHV